MICDTTFVSHFLREQAAGEMGVARRFAAAHRAHVSRITIITAGELAVVYPRSWQVWEALKRWTIYRMHPGIVEAAADVDRQLIRVGQRLGENDNWIAGFCRYYRLPVVSRDEDFDRVPGLRRISY